MARQPKPHKKAFYVRVSLPDETFAFLDATRWLGQKLPFTKPLATCALEVDSKVVAFSLIHLVKSARKALREHPVAFPSSAVARLRRIGARYVDIDAETMVVRYDNHEQSIPIERGEDGRLHINEQGPSFELDYYPTKMDVILLSPATGRVLSVGFIGHLGAAGRTETLGRAAGKVLRSMLGLGSFATLLGSVAVEIPPALQAGVASQVTFSNLERVIPVTLYDMSNPPEVVASGPVKVELDLSTSDPVSQSFLFTVDVHEHLQEAWNDDYQHVLRAALTGFFKQQFGDEIPSLVYDIVLGELSLERKQAIETAFAALPGFGLAPNDRWREEAAS